MNAIELTNIVKKYKDKTVVNNINLNIKEGEFVFVVGDSGSGKSTLIKLLLKELEPTEGKITINGKKSKKNFGTWKGMQRSQNHFIIV